MGYGLPPREVHVLTASDPQQEMPGTPVRTTWTHAGDCQQCQVFGRYHQQGHELERAHQQRLHKSQQDPRLPQEKPEDQLQEDYCREGLQVTDMFAPPALEYACTVWDT